MLFKHVFIFFNDKNINSSTFTPKKLSSEEIKSLRAPIDAFCKYMYQVNIWSFNDFIVSKEDKYAGSFDEQMKDFIIKKINIIFGLVSKGNNFELSAIESFFDSLFSGINQTVQNSENKDHLFFSHEGYEESIDFKKIFKDTLILYSYFSRELNLLGISKAINQLKLKGGNEFMVNRGTFLLKKLENIPIDIPKFLNTFLETLSLKILLEFDLDFSIEMLHKHFFPSVRYKEKFIKECQKEIKINPNFKKRSSLEL